MCEKGVGVQLLGSERAKEHHPCTLAVAWHMGPRQSDPRVCGHPQLPVLPKPKPINQQQSADEKLGEHVQACVHLAVARRNPDISLIDAHVWTFLDEHPTTVFGP